MNTPIKKSIQYDPCILVTSFALLGMGLLMVASSSIVISDRSFGYPFHYLSRQTIYLVLGIFIAIAASRIPLNFWQRMGSYLILISFILLILVLVPGVGREVNGSMRWISKGPFSLQVSEFVKFGVIVFMAGYLVRRQEEVQTRIRGFLKPLLLLGGVALLLLQEPDFGATVVITTTVLAMLFLAGVRMWQFIFLLISAMAALGVLAVSVPYRMLRLTTFMHPWSNAFDTGYQLTQSLIAFGRGGVFGVGLGNSVQKLFYLPEAHTDFLFAVLGEELGLVGQVSVILLFAVLVGRVLLVSYRGFRNGHSFAAYLGWGLGLCLGVQVMINVGVNLGMLPTKGLTLPLMSYGGTSLWLNCIALGVMLRISYESRFKNVQLPSIDRTPLVRNPDRVRMVRNRA